MKAPKRREPPPVIQQSYQRLNDLEAFNQLQEDPYLARNNTGDMQNTMRKSGSFSEAPGKSAQDPRISVHRMYGDNDTFGGRNAGEDEDGGAARVQRQLNRMNIEQEPSEDDGGQR